MAQVERVPTEETAGLSRPDSSQQQQADNNTKKLFYIAREIMTSERVYVDVLRLLNIEFREYVQRARAESRSGLLPDADFVNAGMGSEQAAQAPTCRCQRTPRPAGDLRPLEPGGPLAPFA